MDARWAIDMGEVLMPRTDLGVGVQFGVVLVAWAAGLYPTRDRPEFRLVVVGAGLLTIALMGLRAAH